MAEISAVIADLRKEVSALGGSGIKRNSAFAASSSGFSPWTNLLQGNKQVALEIAGILLVVGCFLYFTKPGWLYQEAEDGRSRKLLWGRFITALLVLAGGIYAGYWYSKAKLGDVLKSFH